MLSPATAFIIFAGVLLALGFIFLGLALGGVFDSSSSRGSPTFVSIDWTTYPQDGLVVGEPENVTVIFSDEVSISSLNPSNVATDNPAALTFDAIPTQSTDNAVIFGVTATTPGNILIQVGPDCNVSLLLDPSITMASEEKAIMPEHELAKVRLSMVSLEPGVIQASFGTPVTYTLTWSSAVNLDVSTFHPVASGTTSDVFFGPPIPGTAPNLTTFTATSPTQGTLEVTVGPGIVATDADDPENTLSVSETLNSSTIVNIMDSIGIVSVTRTLAPGEPLVGAVWTYTVEFNQAVTVNSITVTNDIVSGATFSVGPITYIDDTHISRQLTMLSAGDLRVNFGPPHDVESKTNPLNKMPAGTEMGDVTTYTISDVLTLSASWSTPTPEPVIGSTRDLELLFGESVTLTAEPTITNDVVGATINALSADTLTGGLITVPIELTSLGTLIARVGPGIVGTVTANPAYTIDSGLQTLVLPPITVLENITFTVVPPSGTQPTVGNPHVFTINYNQSVDVTAMVVSALSGGTITILAVDTGPGLTTSTITLLFDNVGTFDLAFGFTGTDIVTAGGGAVTYVPTTVANLLNFQIGPVITIDNVSRTDSLPDITTSTFTYEVVFSTAVTATILPVVPLPGAMPVTASQVFSVPTTGTPPSTTWTFTVDGTVPGGEDSAAVRFRVGGPGSVVTDGISTMSTSATEDNIPFTLTDPLSMVSVLPATAVPNQVYPFTLDYIVTFNRPITFVSLKLTELVDPEPRIVNVGAASAGPLPNQATFNVSSNGSPGFTDEYEVQVGGSPGTDISDAFNAGSTLPDTPTLNTAIVMLSPPIGITTVSLDSVATNHITSNAFSFNTDFDTSVTITTCPVNITGVATFTPAISTVGLSRILFTVPPGTMNAGTSTVQVGPGVVGQRQNNANAKVGTSDVADVPYDITLYDPVTIISIDKTNTNIPLQQGVETEFTIVFSAPVQVSTAADLSITNVAAGNAPFALGSVGGSPGSSITIGITPNVLGSPYELQTAGSTNMLIASSSGTAWVEASETAVSTSENALEPVNATIYRYDDITNDPSSSPSTQIYRVAFNQPVNVPDVASLNLVSTGTTAGVTFGSTLTTIISELLYEITVNVPIGQDGTQLIVQGGNTTSVHASGNVNLTWDTTDPSVAVGIGAPVTFVSVTHVGGTGEVNTPLEFDIVLGGPPGGVDIESSATASDRVLCIPDAAQTLVGQNATTYRLTVTPTSVNPAYTTTVSPLVSATNPWRTTIYEFGVQTNFMPPASSIISDAVVVVESLVLQDVTYVPGTPLDIGETITVLFNFNQPLTIENAGNVTITRGGTATGTETVGLTQAGPTYPNSLKVEFTVGSIGTLDWTCAPGAGSLSVTANTSVLIAAGQSETSDELNISDDVFIPDAALRLTTPSQNNKSVTTFRTALAPATNRRAVTLNYNNQSTYYSNYDGTAWSPWQSGTPLPSPTSAWYWLASNDSANPANSVIVAVNHTSNPAYSNDFGVTWNTATGASQMGTVTFINDTFGFVGGGYNGTIYGSLDGVSWSAVSTTGDPIPSTMVYTGIYSNGTNVVFGGYNTGGIILQYEATGVATGVVTHHAIPGTISPATEFRSMYINDDVCIAAGQVSGTGAKIAIRRAPVVAGVIGAFTLVTGLADQRMSTFTTGLEGEIIGATTDEGLIVSLDQGVTWSNGGSSTIGVQHEIRSDLASSRLMVVGGSAIAISGQSTT